MIAHHTITSSTLIAPPCPSFPLSSGQTWGVYGHIIILMKTLKNGEYEYRQSDFLGEGSFAKVYKGVIVKSQRVVAVRLLPLKLIKQYGNKIKTIINGEVSVLKELAESPDIDYLFTTRIFDCFLTEHNVTMILEFCPDGNLEDIVSKRGPIAEGEALEIAYQLARGLQFIGKKKVVHRDIKPDNVFIKKEGNYTLYKLGDFGFAVKKQLNEQIVGTPIFMSPELFRQEPYGSEVDVWAYGLLVHYLLFKEHYFMENTEKKVEKKVLETRYALSPQQRAKISPATADLLMRCLQFDKAKRIKSQELVSHPAFLGVKEKVDALVRQVTHRNELTESHLRKETAKGKYMSRVMSYNFVNEVGLYLAKKSNFNLASLYLFKFAYSELAAFRERAKKQENVINHPDWPNFITTQEFTNSFGIIDRLLAQFSKVFESYFNSVIGPISQQRPDVAQGVTSNLGSGPLAPINPQIPMYELKNSWLARLGNTPEEYFVKMEILVVLEILKGQPPAIDFCALQLMKKTATVQQIVQLFEEALKSGAN